MVRKSNAGSGIPLPPGSLPRLRLVPGARSRQGRRATERSRNRALERRLAILRAAGSAFRRHGFAQTGMREIASAAGLSPANLYYYFRGKDDLLAFCQDLALDRMAAAIREIGARGLSAEKRLEQVIRSQVLCLLDDLAGAAAHLEVDALPPKIRSRIVAKRDAYERELRDLIAAGAAEGRLAAPDPALAARVILGAVNWTARWFDPDGEKSAAEVADGFAGTLVNGLRSRGGAAR